MAEESTSSLDLAPSVHGVATAAAGEERKKLRRGVGCLDTAFPEEGGPYVWVKLAFGRAATAVVSVPPDYGSQES